MSENASSAPREPADLVSGLIQLVGERIPAESQIPAAHAARQAAVEKQNKQAQQQLADDHRRQHAAVEAEYSQAEAGVQQQYNADFAAAQQQYQTAQDEALGRFDEADQAASRARQEGRWEAMTIFEGRKDGPAHELEELQNQLDARWQQLVGLQQKATAALVKRHQWREYPDPEPANLQLPPEPLLAFDALVQDATYHLQNLLNQGVARVFEGSKPFWYCVLLWLAVAVPAALLLGWQTWHWLALSFGSVALLAGALGSWLYQVARRQSEEGYRELRATILLADRMRPGIIDAATRQAREKYQALVRQRDEDLRRAEEVYKRKEEEIGVKRDVELARAEKFCQEAIDRLKQQLQRELAEVKQKYPALLQRLDEQFRKESERLEAAGRRAVADTEGLYQCRWEEMAEHWRSGVGRFQGHLDELNEQCSEFFPDWDSTDWDQWKPVSDVLPRLRFGNYRIELGRIPGGIPEDPRLKPAKTEFAMPALLAFPEKSALLLKAAGVGRRAAIDLIQAIMLRMLTSLPPGKVRFTIVDPVGLGENFAAFMHLADYDEQLVASRIWTDSSHIAHRLGDLTGHMENVLQVYLRNEFESIQQYNTFAGEMAEPYRILVIANFPANFTEEAGRRLLSIVSSGARCGVFTLMSVNTAVEPPHNFAMADLERYALSFEWRDGHFIGLHPDYGELPLLAEEPPTPERFTEVVRAIGRKVPEAGRIEVPFTHVAPEEGQLWTSDSRGGLDVPLGRAGAMKLQDLRLGKGTSQHVLISGKTGSGKSTLLHILITNTALRYSPDQVEFYLIDFKKGVEFKAYATHRLPHARVIAIESEREFGLSVLERLDAELRTRGDLFRRAGVQDLKGFREAQPETKLPRILLIVDEFQEMFVEEDRISQNAALLMDRLVRQGRAFGIHVLLGSQTLGGAYSLARSTLGQMGVRIALQCSEADAHLILSEDNSAARLLSRPGEAIYNDANGMLEGNHPFQIAWLEDYQRDAKLEEIQKVADARGEVYAPPTVFEGNVAAEIGENSQLAAALCGPVPPEARRFARAWLGSAVSIKEATAATFARQSGTNLLVVGQQEEEALGILASATVSLAAQDAPLAGASAQFYLFDGTRPDAPETGYWKRLAEALPQPSRVVMPGQTAEAIGLVTAELERREQEHLETAPPVYLLIYDLSRFRDLRRSEDDFGFSSFGEEKTVSPAKQFARILRDGPTLGIHTILWCDTLNNVNRWLDRQVMRDLEMRVALQMNATDSSSLIDSPAAGKLGTHRGILYHEGQGTQEKFRPYAPPSADWLAKIREQLRQRFGS